MKVTHLTPVWADAIMTDKRPFVAKVQKTAEGALEMLMMVPAVDDLGNNVRILISCPVVVGPSVKLNSDPEDQRWERWGLRQLGSTVWSLEPSIIHPLGLHAFVTLCDVPDPAPWL